MSSSVRTTPHLYRTGPWAVTLTEFPGAEGGWLDAVVVSHDSDKGRSLAGVSFLQFGEIQIPDRMKGKLASLKSKEASDWGASLIPQGDRKPIDIRLAHHMLGKEAARNLLSGHLLTYFYNPLHRLQVDTPHIDVSSRWDRELKYLLSDGESTLTTFTAQIYTALTEWLEAAPAQLIARMEGVSVSTIRNRLNAARELGLLEKPGAGVRSAKAKSE